MSSDEKLKATKFFVEANSNEQQILWEKYHEKIKWESDNVGCSVVIKEMKIGNKKHPINVSFSFAKINDQMVCFYYACSNFVMHDVVEKWLQKHFKVTYDKGTRWAHTDAGNFHTCLHYCRKPE